MTTSRYIYTMTRRIFLRILKHEGKPPSCRACGKTLRPGMRVLTKISRNKSSYVHRYCSKCRARFKIWIRR